MTIVSQNLALDNEPSTIRITPDAKHLVLYTKQNFRFDSLKLYKLNEKFELEETISKHPNADIEDSISEIFDISPNGRYVAICYRRGGSVNYSRCYLWDVRQKVYLEDFIHPKMEYKSYLSGNSGQGYHYLDVRFMPDNDRLITVSDMGEIFGWSINQKKQLWAITAAAHQANAVAFSNKIGFFAMCERLDKMWRGMVGQHFTMDGKIIYKPYELFTYKSLEKAVYESLNLDVSFRLWNTYSGTLIREFDADYWVNDLVFSHDDKLIAGSMKDTAFVWDVNTGEVVDALPENTNPIGFTANDQSLIVIHEGKSIALWDLATKQWQQHFELDGVISSAQVSQNDKVVALSKTVADWQLHQIQL